MKRFGKTVFSGDQTQEKFAKKSDDSGSCTPSNDGNVPASTSSSPSTSEGRPLSIKSLLRQKIQGKLSTEKESGDSSSRERRQLDEWCGNLKTSGFICEVISLTDRYSPFLHEENNDIPGSSALVVYPSKDHTYSSETGPFQPVRLVIFPDGSWRLQCPIYEFQDVSKGKLSPFSCEEVLSLVSSWFTQYHALCPGLIGLEDVEGKLGYIPKNVRVLADPVKIVQAVSCKVWHVPSSQARKDESDARRFHVCGECLRAHSYVQRRITEKNNVDTPTKCKRQSPSSNYPIKYLSPNSKQKRYSHLKNDRLRLKRRVDRFYKKTKIELPENQSIELCQLVEAIEDSEDGKDKLKKIVMEGNALKDNKGNSSGVILEEVWKKDRVSFFKDQQRNGKLLYLSLIIRL